MVYLIINFFRHIEKKFKFKILMLVVLMIIVSFSEIISISSIVPFLGAITAPEKIFNNSLVHPYFGLLGIDSSKDLILALTIFFGSAAIFAGFMRLLLIYSTTKLSASIGMDLSLKIFRKTLYQPYSAHLERSSSVIIDAMSNKINIVIASFVLGSLLFVSSFIIIFVILCGLLAINLQITLITFFSLGAIYFLFVNSIKKGLRKNSEIIASESVQLIKILQESIGSIRDILINGSQEIYCETYSRTEKNLRSAQASNHFMGNGPKFLMESFGLFFIAILAYTLIKIDPENGITSVIPIIGMLGLASQRLLPLIQQVYTIWVGFLASRESLIDIQQLLDQEIKTSLLIENNRGLLDFRNAIKFKNVVFKYAVGHKSVIENVSFEIKKGAKVGFVGETGSGKSTLLDILMALLVPTRGSIYIDNKKISNTNSILWQRQISHIPQFIFLFDSTIKNNIVFSEPKELFDKKRFDTVIKIAQLEEFILSLPNKYNTKIGERGIKLSGGQRQRIGIARALYRKCEVLIMDEATSALDNATERKIIKAIKEFNPKFTILMVAHRIDTLKYCDVIFELADGQIKRKLTFKKLIEEQEK